VKHKYGTAFGIDYTYVIDAAARRQKWIDQSQSVNLFLGQPDFKTLSYMYRAAWRKGLKTTYYLRTLGASNIEKATVEVKKEIRGHIGRSDGEEAPAPATAEAATGETGAPFAGPRRRRRRRFTRKGRRRRAAWRRRCAARNARRASKNAANTMTSGKTWKAPFHAAASSRVPSRRSGAFCWGLPIARRL